ncbi:MAG: MoaD/ThiS family protein [Proteobacteria bacterium]|nr:MoaD/ThiS family protein [Pseudomonadota bacterium]
MNVFLKLSASLRGYIEGYNPQQGLTAGFEPGESLADLLGRLGIPLDKIKIIMINGRHGDSGHRLEDGDRIGLFPPVGGG